jgi:hypothetical protein
VWARFDEEIIGTDIYFHFSEINSTLFNVPFYYVFYHFIQAVLRHAFGKFQVKLLKIICQTSEFDTSSSDCRICELHSVGKGEEGGYNGWHVSTDWTRLSVPGVGAEGVE